MWSLRKTAFRLLSFVLALAPWIWRLCFLTSFGDEYFNKTVTRWDIRQTVPWRASTPWKFGASAASNPTTTKTIRGSHSCLRLPASSDRMAAARRYVFVSFQFYITTSRSSIRGLQEWELPELKSNKFSEQQSWYFCRQSSSVCAMPRQDSRRQALTRARASCTTPNWRPPASRWARSSWDSTAPRSRSCRSNAPSSALSKGMAKLRWRRLSRLLSTKTSMERYIRLICNQDNL